MAPPVPPVRPTFTSILRKPTSWVLAVWGLLVLWGIISIVALWPLRWWWGAWPAGWTLLASALVTAVLAFRRRRSFYPRWVPHAVGILVSAAVVAIGLGSMAGYIGKGTPAPPDSITDPLAQGVAVYQWANAVFEGDPDPHFFDEQRLSVHDTISVLGLSQLPADTVGRGVDATGAVDTTRLVVWGLGPEARVFPAVGAHRNARSNYIGSGSGKGRIIMKFEVDSSWRNGAGYGKLRLPPGTSYLWVDSMVFERDTAPPAPGMGRLIAHARGLIITRTGAIRADSAIRVEEQRRRWSSDARARWRWDPTDECVCNDCIMHGWCGFGCSGLQ